MWLTRGIVAATLIFGAVAWSGAEEPPVVPAPPMPPASAQPRPPPGDSATAEEWKKYARELMQEQRQRNLEVDRALCAKSKDPALCEMLATRLRGIEDKLQGIGIDVELSGSQLLGIELAIRELIESRR